MQTVMDGYNATGGGGQVFSWIDDPAARVAAPGLHGRSVLSDLDLSRADVDALVETALWLKVQRERADGSWKTLTKTYRTHGSAETRNINLPSGTYRVRVNPKFGHQGVTTSVVTLIM